MTTYIVSGGALNSTHSLTALWVVGGKTTLVMFFMLKVVPYKDWIEELLIVIVLICVFPTYNIFSFLTGSVFNCSILFKFH